METNYSRWKPILLVCRFSDPYFYFFFCRSPFFCLRRPFNFFSFPHLYQRLSTSFATTPSYGVCKAIYTVWLSFLSFRRTRSPVIRHLPLFLVSRISPQGGENRETLFRFQFLFYWRLRPLRAPSFLLFSFSHRCHKPSRHGLSLLST